MVLPTCAQVDVQPLTLHIWSLRGFSFDAHFGSFRLGYIYPKSNLNLRTIKHEAQSNNRARFECGNIHRIL